MEEFRDKLDFEAEDLPSYSLLGARRTMMYCTSGAWILNAGDFGEETQELECTKGCSYY